MARQHPDDVKKELQQQEDDVYGDETISGSNPRPSSDDSVDDYVEDVIGNEPEDGEPFNIGDEINRDEAAVHGRSPSDGRAVQDEVEEAIPDSGLEAVEKKEAVVEDPLDDVTIDDFDTDEDEAEEE